MITAERLHKLFIYDEATGLLRARCPRGNLSTNDIVGSLSDGYIRLRVDGVRMFAHRVIWHMHYGSAASGTIDHVDGDRCNNKVANLRLATNTQNQANAKMNINNKSGFKGVSFSSKYQRWCAFISENGKNKNLGSFNSPEAAHRAYAYAAIARRGEYARTK